jgi:hypothetical protein
MLKIGLCRLPGISRDAGCAASLILVWMQDRLRIESINLLVNVWVELRSSLAYVGEAEGYRNGICRGHVLLIENTTKRSKLILFGKIDL